MNQKDKSKDKPKDKPKETPNRDVCEPKESPEPKAKPKDKDKKTYTKDLRAHVFFFEFSKWQRSRVAKSHVTDH